MQILCPPSTEPDILGMGPSNLCSSAVEVILMPLKVETTGLLSLFITPLNSRFVLIFQNLSCSNKKKISWEFGRILIEI